MSNYPNHEICFEYPINSDVLIDFLSLKELFIVERVDADTIIIKDVPYICKDIKMPPAKVSITIKRNSPITEEQLLAYLREANLPIEEFDVFVRISTMVNKSQVKFKK